jgi:hypothetical protein
MMSELPSELEQFTRSLTVEVIVCRNIHLLAESIDTDLHEIRFGVSNALFTELGASERSQLRHHLQIGSIFSAI